MRILAERHSKTEGAVAKAQADVAAADAKTKDYEERMREARMGIFKAQEARRQAVAGCADAAISEARAAAEAKVKAARAEIEKEAAIAKAGLAGQTETLAQEVIRAVLSPRVGRTDPGRCTMMNELRAIPLLFRSLLRAMAAQKLPLRRLPTLRIN